LPHFYTQQEREELKGSSTIPLRTFVLLGQFHGTRDVGASTTEIRTGLPNMSDFPVRISNFLLGSLVIQVVSAHLAPEYGDRPIGIGSAEGPWDHLLLRCWPADGRNIYWPPLLAMDFSRTIIDFRRVSDRFNLGKDVPIPPKRTDG
jgi:hypothetical protein